MVSAKGLVVFDMDGTLIPGQTASQNIGNETNTLSKVHRLEAAYRQGICTPAQFATELHETWSEYPGCYRKAFENSVLLKGITPAVETLHSLGYATCLITMSPLAYAINFAEFEFVFGSQPPHSIISPDDKPLIAKQLANSMNISNKSLIAVGDSSSDIPLFKMASYSLAVNGDSDIEALASHSYRGGCLEQAITKLSSVLK